jgi:hypothetical protein
VYIVDPRNMEVLESNLADLVSDAIDKPLDGIEQEGRDVPSISAGPVQFSVVAVASEVVVIRQEVSGRERDAAGSSEQQELNETGSAAVAIAEGVNPREV